MSSITENGDEVHFNRNVVTISYGNRIILERQKMRNGLFQVKLKEAKKRESFLTDNSSNKVVSWHRKMGHTSNDKIKTLFKMIGIEMTSADFFNLEKVCRVFMEAKQTRLKFEN